MWTVPQKTEDMQLRVNRWIEFFGNHALGRPESSPPLYQWSASRSRWDAGMPWHPPISLGDPNGRSPETLFLRIPAERIKMKKLADNGNK